MNFYNFLFKAFSILPEIEEGEFNKKMNYLFLKEEDFSFDVSINGFKEKVEFKFKEINRKKFLSFVYSPNSNTNVQTCLLFSEKDIKFVYKKYSKNEEFLDDLSYFTLEYSIFDLDSDRNIFFETVVVEKEISDDYSIEFDAIASSFEFVSTVEEYERLEKKYSKLSEIVFPYVRSIFDALLEINNLKMKFLLI